MAVIEFDGDNHFTADGWTVAVYEMNRHYGGPEEGGWWYDSRELVAVATADDETDTARVVAELESGPYRSTGDRFSVYYGRRGDVEYRMYIHAPGDKITHRDPLETPHYE